MPIDLVAVTCVFVEIGALANLAEIVFVVSKESDLNIEKQKKNRYNTKGSAGCFPRFVRITWTT